MSSASVQSEDRLPTQHPRADVDRAYASAELPPAYDRSILIIYLCYRLGITALLWALSFTNSAIGEDYPQLFYSAGLSYFSINVLLLAMVLRGWKPSQNAVLFTVLSDILLVQLIALASGPIVSGLGALMVISVAAGAIFIRSARSLIPPAFASLFLFAGVAFRVLDQVAGQNEIVASGWLGLSFFVTSMAISHLAKRMQLSEARAMQEAMSARKLEQLNQLIIARMQTGVIIANADGRLLACNRSARRILPPGLSHTDCSLSDINPQLADYHRSVHRHFASREAAADTRARFSTSLSTDNTDRTEFRLTWVSLDAENSAESMIFVEDLSKITQQAQQLKLSSLGKLTASIAHEIRNPLGAASHAAQLLRESSSGNDLELANMVVDHCNRCSKIISNIMEVSRGEPAREMLIDIADWLARFTASYEQEQGIGIELRCPNAVLARFDPAHLEQVIRNLLDNAINHSTAKLDDALPATSDDQREQPGTQQSEHAVGISVWLDDGCAIIDIQDTGNGVEENNQERLFEPFFTTGRTGSGLGLYICRELCSANQAALSYVADVQTHSKGALQNNYARHSFRIRFSHPDRQSLNLTGSLG